MGNKECCNKMKEVEFVLNNYMDDVQSIIKEMDNDNNRIGYLLNELAQHAARNIAHHVGVDQDLMEVEYRGKE